MSVKAGARCEAVYNLREAIHGLRPKPIVMHWLRTALVMFDLDKGP
jgi:uncharacterized protein VirK/YbjX